MPGCSKPTPPNQGPAAAATVAGPTPCPHKAADPWIQDILAIMCPKDKAFLQDLKARGVTITAFDRIYFDDPYYDGTKWTTKRFEAGGTTHGTTIHMIRSKSATENAATIFHEGVHTGQPASMQWRDKEYDAYTKEDQWRLTHGLPAHSPTFRTKDAQGVESTDTAAIKAFVDREYPGVTVQPSKGAPAESVVDHDPVSNKTLVRRDDGKTYWRAPKKGDSHPAASPVNVPAGGVPVDMDQLQCC